MMLRGRISGGSGIKCSLSGSSALSGKLTMGSKFYPFYEGVTEFVPSESEQTIDTHGKAVLTDIIVDAIPPEYIVPSGTKAISANGEGIDVSEYAEVDVDVQPSLQSKTATPTESAQTIAPDSGYDGLSSVNVGAISPTYVGSGVNVFGEDPDDLRVYGDVLYLKQGFIDAGGADNYAFVPFSSFMPWGNVTAEASCDANGLITATAAYASNDPDWQNVTYSANDTQTATVQLPTQAAATITPTTSAQMAVAAGRFTTGNVTVAAMPTGTAGTPTASKTVSGHIATITPSVTNAAGYIAGGTLAGTAVSVSASELVSGTYTVSASGMHDVANYASASVASATPTNSSDSEYITSSGARKWRYRPKTIVPTAGWADQHSASSPINGFWATYDAIPTGTTVTPTTSAQTIGGADTMMEGAVTVAAIPPEYIVPTGTKSIAANGTGIDVTGYAAVDVAVPSSSVKTATGTFTGNGTRTIDVACAFEPDIVYFTSDPGTTASSGTVAAIIVRDMMTATRYRNNSTTNSHYAIPGIADLNSNGSSYSWRATYANSKVTLYCYSSNARGLLTSGRTYSYTFIKWT